MTSFVARGREALHPPSSASSRTSRANHASRSRSLSYRLSRHRPRAEETPYIHTPSSNASVCIVRLISSYCRERSALLSVICRSICFGVSRARLHVRRKPTVYRSVYTLVTQPHITSRSQASLIFSLYRLSQCCLSCSGASSSRQQPAMVSIRMRVRTSHGGSSQPPLKHSLNTIRSAHGGGWAPPCWRGPASGRRRRPEPPPDLPTCRRRTWRGTRPRGWRAWHGRRGGIRP